MNDICKKCRFYPVIKDSLSMSSTIYPCDACKFNPYLNDNYEEDIKACPFCGWNASLHSCEDDYGNVSYLIECDNENCGVEISYYKTKEEAIRKWNTRVK